MEGSASLLLFVLQVGVVVGTVLGHQPCTSANLDAPRMAVDIDQEISADRIRIRHAMLTDVPEMQRINCICLPENYHRESYWMHILRWPSIVHVAEARVRSSCSSRGADGTQDDGWAVVAYVLAKMQDDDGNEQDRQALAPDADRKGHITSLAVMRSHRRLGIAKRLMQASFTHMMRDFKATSCFLHVRCSNAAALPLYRDALGFRVVKTEKGYYGDGEDALSMLAPLDSSNLLCH